MPAYVVGLIELAEQQGMQLNAVVDVHPAAVRIGQAVELRIVDLGDSGYRITEFVPAKS